MLTLLAVGGSLHGTSVRPSRRRRRRAFLAALGSLGLAALLLWSMT